jgi:phage gpG-like protein
LINVDLSIGDLTAVMARLQKMNQSGAPELFRRIAGVIHAGIDENFVRGGRPKWIGLKPVVDERSKRGSVASQNKRVFYRTVNTSGRQILRLSGRLQQSLTEKWDGFSSTVGTNVIYAKIHNFGGVTKAHDIVPRNGTALRFGNRFAKIVKHPGSRIPAREFMVLGADNKAEISTLAQNWFRGIIGS